VSATGAVFDDQTDMPPVTRTVAVDFAPDQAEPAPLAVEDFTVVAKKSPRYVLVVDDEPLIRWSVAESLADLGIDVDQAGDARSALRSVTSSGSPFDVVVLDLRLPDMRDLSLLATLRQLLPEARLILMTAFGSPDITAEAALLGAAVLNKPFELYDMTRLVLGPAQGPA
jgi:DNA-binding NtrC family response regulator